MTNHANVSEHYAHGDLPGSIHTGVTALGKTTDSVTVHDLAFGDEFHIDGRQAAEEFPDQFNLSIKAHMLDIGCGLGVLQRYARATCSEVLPRHTQTGWLNGKIVGPVLMFGLRSGETVNRFGDKGTQRKRVTEGS